MISVDTLIKVTYTIAVTVILRTLSSSIELGVFTNRIFTTGIVYTIHCIGNTLLLSPYTFNK